MAAVAVFRLFYVDDNHQKQLFLATYKVCFAANCQIATASSSSVIAHQAQHIGRPLRVLIISPGFATKGGMQVYCQTLMKFMNADVELLEVGRKSDGETRWLLVPRVFEALGKFLRCCVVGRFDVIHVNTSLVTKQLLREGLLLLAARLSNKPVLVFFHGWTESVANRLSELRLLLLLFKLIFSRANAFVVLAQDFKNVLENLGFQQPIIKETTFVDNGIFETLDETPAFLRNRKDNSPLTLVFLSRILREKGIFIALECYRNLRKKRKDMVLLVVGDGPALDEARRFVDYHAIEGVEFLGFLTGHAKRDVLLRSDIFVLPTSYGEGMPISMLEAMICGLPVLVPPVGGIKDFFVDGKMGFLMPDNTPQAYAARIEELMVNPSHYKEMSRYNHHYAKEHFLASAAAERLVALYRKLVKDASKEHS